MLYDRLAASLYGGSVYQRVKTGRDLVAVLFYLFW